MNIFNLPYDIFPDTTGVTEDIIIHDFTAKKGAFKGKSILHTNAISMVITGEKTMHFAEKTVRVNDSEIHFLSSGNCIASMDLSHATNFRSILIFFTNKVLADFYLKYNSLISKARGKQAISPEPYLFFKKDAFIYKYIESMALLTQPEIKISPEMKSIKFEELMLHLLENYPRSVLSFPLDPKDHKEDLIIRKAVETNITNNITVEDLAFLCNTSLSTFKRRFMKIYGTSPNKWLLQRRMEIAKDLLLNYHEKPGEVYHKVGYENHSSFTKSFRQIYGMTPKDLQTQHLNVYQ